MGKKKVEPKAEPRTFRFACTVVGVAPVLAAEYEQLIGPETAKSIVALLDQPDRYLRIRETLFTAIDDVTKAAAEPAAEQPTAPPVQE